MNLRLLISRLLADLPVIAIRGLIRGSKWTAFPHSAYWRGTHEPAIQNLIANRRPDRSEAAWDFGAHFGFYTVAFARAVGSTGQVASFEPNPSAFQKLSRHISMNGLPQVILFNAAVSDTNSVLQLIRDESATSPSHHLPYHGEVLNPDTLLLTVTALRADDLVAAGKIRLPTFVKIDVEGHAAEAVAGAIESLRAATPKILLATHSPEEIAGVRRLLEPLGYSPHDLADRPLNWADVGVGNDYFLRVGDASKP